MVVRDGHYYLFWSTQRRTFDPAVQAGPNGLYAMVADRLRGPYRPVNGNCLIAGNPAAEPTQGYSWWVTGEGEVWSFIDHWGMAGRSFDQHPELLRQQFGGTPAPRFRLAFAGDRVTII
jgi:levansucrase